MWQDLPSGPAGQNDSERLLVLLSYGLLLIAPMAGGLPGVIGVIIAHVRLRHVLGSIHESHYRNQIRVFWTLSLFAIVMILVLTYGMGFSFFALMWPFSPGWPFWPGAMLGLSWAMFLPLAALFSLALGLWYFWRLLLGFVRALDDKPF